MDIRYFDSLESTNLYCKLLDPNTVGEFTVICARTQSAGIGQQGNVWVSEPGKNITFSIILRPTFLPAARQYDLTMTLAVAVAETVEKYCGLHNTLPVAIKWPNDIYVGDRKICGILTTCNIKDMHLSQAICGIGLNVNQTVFPEWVPNPVSLKQLTGCDCKIEPVLNDLLQSIKEKYTILKSDPNLIAEQYISLLYRLGTESSYLMGDREIRAKITGVNKFGHLQLLTSDGENVSCDIKEVKFV